MEIWLRCLLQNCYKPHPLISITLFHKHLLKRKLNWKLHSFLKWMRILIQRVEYRYWLHSYIDNGCTVISFLRNLIQHWEEIMAKCLAIKMNNWESLQYTLTTWNFITDLLCFLSEMSSVLFCSYKFSYKFYHNTELWNAEIFIISWRLNANLQLRKKCKIVTFALWRNTDVIWPQIHSR